MLVRSNSLVPVLGTRGGLDRVFEDLLGEFPFAGTFVTESGRYPAVNTWEDEKSFFVEAEVPGLKREEIEISVLGNELRISGGTEKEEEEKSAKFHRRERFVGKFSRVLRFPCEIDNGKVEAKYEAGILTIALPKAAAALPRKIEVKS
jgi:HSP20 family protein